jgi:hypothetical protein
VARQLGTTAATANDSRCGHLHGERFRGNLEYREQLAMAAALS